MKKPFLCLCLAAVSAAWAAPTCTPTGFMPDGINLTAALIDPPGTVSGDVDGTGCNIVVYYDHGRGSINKANLHGANYFGVVVNGDSNNVSVDISNSSIHDIGESPINGAQHGEAIYYRGLGSGAASGKISGNTIMQYQKGGMVISGDGASVNIQDNVVTGLGRVNFIAGNGIQIGYGANAQVMRNTVSGNAYTGPNCADSGGIIVVGGPAVGVGGDFTIGTQIQGNTVVNNDVGVFLYNLDFSGPPVSATNIKVINNTITNDALTNISGNELTCGDPTSGGGYQAGIFDAGTDDKLINNTISGAGYTTSNATTYAVPIDTGFSSHPKVHADK